jgi:integrase
MGCEFIDSLEVGKRMGRSPAWVHDQVRSRSSDPMPRYKFGNFVRFDWASEEFRSWLNGQQECLNDRGRVDERRKKMRTRHQKGYVYKDGGWWFVRYREDLLDENGTTIRKQRTRKLVEVCDQYRTRSSVRSLAEEVLAPINSASGRIEGTFTLGQFVAGTYLPEVKAQKRASTYKGYKDLWENHLKQHCDGIRLREFRTLDGERMLGSIAKKSSLNKTSLKHIKSLLSGIFTHARRIGALSSANPIQGVSIPKARGAGETFAYSIEEINRMLAALPEPAATVVATAAFAGLRYGELRGLNWRDYDGTKLEVRNSIWKNVVNDPKTERSKSPVPVVGPLASRLDVLRASQGNPSDGYIFAGPRKGRPLDLNNLAHREIKPVLKEIGIRWHGWHAFRRGLATNLHRLGVPDKTIQAILRHEDIKTTQNIYIKHVSAESVAAMSRLEQEFANCAANVQLPNSDASTLVQ